MTLRKRSGSSNSGARRRRRLNKPAMDYYNVPDSDEEPGPPPQSTQLITNWDIRSNHGSVSTSHHTVQIPSSPDRSPNAQHSAHFAYEEPPLNALDFDFGTSFNNTNEEQTVPDHSSFLEDLSMSTRKKRSKSVSLYPVFLSTWPMF